MPKTILIFSDGTGQAGGLRPDEKLSNVYKLYRASRTGPDSSIDPQDQIAYYSPGLGSAEIAGPALLQPLVWVRKMLSSATGKGFARNVTDCYEAILRLYQPGDRIFLIGFSRGAYTVRTVAGVMNLCGVPVHDANGDPIPKSGPDLRAIASEAVNKVYMHGAGRNRHMFEGQREELARRFRVAYRTEDCVKTNRRGDVAPYFIGVFDTVASLGTTRPRQAAILGVTALAAFAAAWISAKVLDWLTALDWSGASAVILGLIGLIGAAVYVKSELHVIRDWPEPGRFAWHFAGWSFTNYDKYLDPRVKYVRHALSLDERRADFDRVGWGKAADVQKAADGWMIQKWFAGNHSDIGGGYPEAEARLSDISLQWMLDEMTGCEHPLVYDPEKLRLFPDHRAPQHCEVQASLDRWPSWIPKAWRLGWSEKARTGANLENTHPSVLERIRLDHVYVHGRPRKYRPPSLAQDAGYKDFLKTIEAERDSVPTPE